MSLDWKLQRRLGNHPDNLMLFLVISLLLHGVVFLGIETYWPKIVNHLTRNDTDAPIPVQYIEVPPDVSVTPPLDAKQKASNNSKAGGDARPELPIAVEAIEARSTAPLPSSQPSFTQSTSSTAQPSPPPPQQPQLTDDKPNISPSVAPMPTPESSSRQPQGYNSSLLGDPVNPASHDFTGDRQDNLAKPLTSGKANISPPIAPMPTPDSLRQGYNTSLLGGSVNLASRDFRGYYRDQLANANRLAPGFNGVDARQDVYLSPFLDKLRGRVEQQWLPKLSNSSEQTIIGFSVSRTGQITDLRILQPSGSTLTDQAALKAIQRAAPFEPLPEAYQADKIDIHFTFNINVYGELKPKSVDGSSYPLMQGIPNSDRP